MKNSKDRELPDGNILERLHAAERAYKDGETAKARERLLEIAAEIDGVSDMEDRKEKEMGKEQEKLDAMPRHKKCFYYQLGSFDQMRNGHEHFCVPKEAKTLGERWRMKQELDPADCENCQRYKCRYIEYPLTIDGLDIKPPEPWGAGLTPVRIRPCRGDKTYFGVHLGEFPRHTTARFNSVTRRMEIQTICNPCIYIPELKKTVFGDESWWGEIEPGEDISDITDETIQGQWYVRLMELLPERKEAGQAPASGDADPYAESRLQQMTKDPKNRKKGGENGQI